MSKNSSSGQSVFFDQFAFRHFLRSLCCSLAIVPLLLGGFLASDVRAQDKDAEPYQQKYSPDDEFVERMAKKAVAYLEDKTPREAGELILAAIVVVEVSKRYEEIVPVDHPIVVKAVEVIQKEVDALREHIKNNVTSGQPEIRTGGIYKLALGIILLTDLSVDKYKADIRDMVNYMLTQQLSTGGFGYSNPGGEDTSQSQYAGLAFAVLKIHEYDIPPDRAVKLLDWYCKTQLHDSDNRGSWVYTYRNYLPIDANEVARHPLHVAGISSVYLLADYLNLGATGGRAAKRQIEGISRLLPPSVVEHIPNKKQGARTNAPLAGFDRGLLSRTMSEGNQWIAKNYTIEVPKNNWTFYYLYALERYAYFREKNEGIVAEFPQWYDEGVEYLAGLQGGNGQWTPQNKGVETDANSTCLATLFLVRSSQILLKDPRQSTLVSNYGIFKENSRIKEGPNGTFATEKDVQSVTDVLDMLEKGASEEQMAEMIDQLKWAIKDFATREKKSKAELSGFLRGLVVEYDPYRRMAAVKILAGLQDLDNVPALLYALGDPEPEIAIEAHNGLRLISRKLDTFQISIKPNEIELRDLKAKWTDWYLGIRPGAELLD